MAILVSTLIVGCGASVPPPSLGWLPTKEEATREPYGGWIALRLREPIPEDKDPELKGLVRFHDASMRRGPSFMSGRVCFLSESDAVRIIGREGDWYEVVGEGGEHGWVLVREEKGRRDAHRIGGELIALQNDSLFVLLDRSLVGVPIANVRGGFLWGYRTPAGLVGAWVALGAVSAFSHGIGGIITFPAWLLIGIPSAVAVSRVGRIPVKPDRMEEIQAYARFPQGIPAAVDRDSLKAKRTN